MEIHGPEQPFRSLKDFGLHIATVTLGILLALAFEGIREWEHDRHLLRETRENIHREMDGDQKNSVDELERVTATHDHLDELTKSFAEVAKDADKLSDQLDDIDNPFYFFSSNSWEAALSTGALARMSPAEVAAYANAAEGIRRYTALQNATLAEETQAVAFLRAHPRPTATQMEDATQMLLTLTRDEQGLVWVCPQMQDAVATALRASARY